MPMLSMLVVSKLPLKTQRKHIRPKKLFMESRNRVCVMAIHHVLLLTTNKNTIKKPVITAIPTRLLGLRPKHADDMLFPGECKLFWTHTQAKLPHTCNLPMRLKKKLHLGNHSSCVCLSPGPLNPHHAPQMVYTPPKFADFGKAANGTSLKVFLMAEQWPKFEWGDCGIGKGMILRLLVLCVACIIGDMSTNHACMGGFVYILNCCGLEFVPMRPTPLCNACVCLFILQRPNFSLHLHSPPQTS